MPRSGPRTPQRGAGPRSAVRTVPVRWSDRLGSTQDEARALLAQGRQAPFAVATTDQRGGRGRLGRQWSSPPGQGLALTVVHRTSLVPEERSWCSLVVGLALLGLVDDLLLGLSSSWVGAAGLGLKWPNDVHDARGRKLAGILVEATADGHLLSGIGLNLRGPVQGSDGAVMEAACALTDIEGVAEEDVERNVGRLAATLARSVVAELRLLEAAGGDAVASGQVERYRESCITLSRSVRVTGAGSRPTVEGTVTGVDDRGRLVVLDRAGREHRIDVGDVEHVRDAPMGSAAAAPQQDH